MCPVPAVPAWGVVHVPRTCSDLPFSPRQYSHAMLAKLAARSVAVGSSAAGRGGVPAPSLGARCYTDSIGAGMVGSQPSPSCVHAAASCHCTADVAVLPRHPPPSLSSLLIVHLPPPCSTATTQRRWPTTRRRRDDSLACAVGLPLPPLRELPLRPSAAHPPARPQALKGETPTFVPNAEGWNETLASVSEAVVKVGRLRGRRGARRQGNQCGHALPRALPLARACAEGTCSCAAS
jgi:hypothetical protein